MQREQEKAALAIEKANRKPRPAVGGIRSSQASVGSAKKSLKFKQTESGATPGTNPATTDNVCVVCKGANSKTQQMLLKQDPANRSLLNDNQVLTNELVNTNRELTKVKAEARVNGETYKKSEKENLDLKKNLGAK